jgi:hypothetical protein
MMRKLIPAMAQKVDQAEKLMKIHEKALDLIQQLIAVGTVLSTKQGCWKTI